MDGGTDGVRSSGSRQSIHGTAKRSPSTYTSCEPLVPHGRSDNILQDCEKSSRLLRGIIVGDASRVLEISGLSIHGHSAYPVFHHPGSLERTSHPTLLLRQPLLRFSLIKQLIECQLRDKYPFRLRNLPSG